MTMFQAIRKRLTPSTVIATLALVFAMSGGAYAASKYLITSTKQIKPSVLKKLTGKAGPAGKEGLAGKTGTNGAQGPAGEKGTAGTNGVNGKDGTNGESVTIKPYLTSGSECKKQGGSEFKVGSAAPTFACNGADGKPGEAGKTVKMLNETPAGCPGAKGFTYRIEGTTEENEVCDGKEGSPWVAGTAPPGVVMKGTFATAYNAAAAEEEIPVAISTGVPILPYGSHPIVYVTEANHTTTESLCPGNAEKPEPATAAAQTNHVNMCVYFNGGGKETNLTIPTYYGPHVPESGGGVVLGGLTSTASGPVMAYGSWSLVTP
jgi:hypothetical protein